MNKELTILLKNIIQRKGLISSGKLLNSIQVYVILRNDIQIDIKCVDYFKYLFEKERIYESFIEDQIFSQEISKIFIDMFNNEIESILNNENYNENNDLKIYITINGR